jgi:ABC-type phosphate transport system substrate-binding protein
VVISYKSSTNQNQDKKGNNVMNIKKIVVSVFAGAAMLTGLVGTAPAVEINVYGASAQYLYWNAMAPTLLGTTTGGQGCTTVQQAVKDSKNAISKGTGCPGGTTIYWRVSSKASYDGPSALLGDDHYAAVGPAAEKCSAGDPGDPGASLRGYYRKMVDENSCTWGTPAAPGSCTALKCVRVTVGVSDVAAQSFTQSSTGQLKGPAGGGVVSRSFTGINPVGLSSSNPIVVPFAFFANNTVQRDLNYGGAPNFQTITNLPRIMAVQIFSGQAWNWKDLGDDFNTQPIVACMRHAGSGTHASLDLAVMNGKWGGNTFAAESAGGPTVWFNDGAADEMNCIDTVPGAVGYQDADQKIGVAGSFPNTVRLTYNGEAPTRVNIRNGRYDFWTKEWAYENPSAPEYSVTHPHVAAAMNLAAQPANIPTAGYWGPDKTQYWASYGEMNYMKSSDSTYPGFVGATNPVLP